MLCISSVDINVNMKYVKIARQACLSLPQDVTTIRWMYVCYVCMSTMLRFRGKYVMDAVSVLIPLSHAILIMYACILRVCRVCKTQQE